MEQSEHKSEAKLIPDIRDARDSIPTYNLRHEVP